jgi:16S rRNA U1498 N3-methylase RsmE
MAEKSEFVDMIREATRQSRRRVMPRIIEPEVKETSRLSHWPPER